MIKTYKQFETIKWSGGDSTELFIFPENSDYKKMNFQFRLSTATVEVEESIFTPLESVSRKLMVLEGKMDLEHENHHKSSLGKFDVDEFDGGWQTSSKGKCIDFNLMLREGTKGSVKGLHLNKGETLQGEFFGNQFFIWSFTGSGKCKIGSNTFEIKEKEMLHIQDSITGQIELEGLSNVDFVIVEIL
jgi:environmental stress-induced protein Ves